MNNRMFFVPKIKFGTTPLMTEVKQFPHTGRYTLDHRNLFIGNVEDNSNGKSNVSSVTV